MTAVIFCGGNIESYSDLPYVNYNEAYVLCADSGVRHAIALGLKPNVIIGDRDSWKEEYPDADKVIVCPPEKDFTDTALCVDTAIEYGCDEILLFGGTGGRLDHEFSHFCLMAHALECGVRLKLIDNRNEIWMENKPFTLKRGEKRYVSFFPYGGDVEGFTVSGLLYTAENMHLSCSEAAASSNEFGESDTAEISFSCGTVLVMLCRD